MSYLLEYYSKIKSSEIIVGKELLMQLEMLMKDMKDDKYKFDLTEAHKRIKFIEAECKHSISPFAGKPFKLELWQKAHIEACYGFYIYIEDICVRRFNYTTLIVGRKNGKSTYAAALALAEFFCGNAGTNILLASNDYEQAGILFDEVNNMREESPSLVKRTRKNLRGIFMGNTKQKTKKGKFSMQNKAKIKKLSMNTGGKEGRNIDLAVIDETHEMKDDSLIMPIVQSTSTKDELLIIEISTEGNVLNGHLDKHLIECRKSLRGESEHDSRHLIWLYTQDSEAEIWRDRNSWVKSNPNLGVSKKWVYLDGLVEKAKIDNEKRSFMLAKDFNIKQNAAIAWLNPTDILNTDTFAIDDIKGCYYVGGNDFAETTDLCASTLIIYKENKKYNLTHYWITNNKLESNNDDADYLEWARQGFITIVDNTYIDTSIIADWHLDLYRQYALKPYKIGYDRRFATSYKARFIEHFGDDSLLVDVIQNPTRLNEPMKALGIELRKKELNYQNNPVTYYCLCNTGFKRDNKDFIQPCKISQNKRIDGAASTITAYAVYKDVQTEYEKINI